MTGQQSFLKKAWNALFSRTAKELSISELMSHPRVLELREQMEPLLTSPCGDIFMLDKQTGNFYLKSDINRQGTDKAKPLGRIDMKSEQLFFDFAARMVTMEKVFGDASEDNPIVVDPVKGTIFAEKDPSKIRGRMYATPEVTVGAGKKPKSRQS